MDNVPLSCIYDKDAPWNWTPFYDREDVKAAYSAIEESINTFGDDFYDFVTYDYKHLFDVEEVEHCDYLNLPKETRNEIESEFRGKYFDRFLEEVRREYEE